MPRFLSATLKNRQEDPHALTMTSLIILCHMQIKARPMKQLPVRVFYIIQCMQSIVVYENKFLVRLLSNTLQYRKDTVKENLKRYYRKAGNDDKILQGKHVLFCEVWQAVWDIVFYHHGMYLALMKTGKKIRRSLLCYANNFTSALTLLDSGKLTLVFVCPSDRS